MEAYRIRDGKVQPGTSQEALALLARRAREWQRDSILSRAKWPVLTRLVGRPILAMSCRFLRRSRALLEPTSDLIRPNMDSFDRPEDERGPPSIEASLVTSPPNAPPASAATGALFRCAA